MSEVLHVLQWSSAEAHLSKVLHVHQDWDEVEVGLGISRAALSLGGALLSDLVVVDVLLHDVTSV